MTYKKKGNWSKPPDIRIPFVPGYPPSEEQKEILSEGKFGDENIHIDASAGSGKSTTLKWLMTVMPKRRGCMVSFGRDIATAIRPGCPPNIDVETLHAFGRRALVAHFNTQPKLLETKNKVIFQELYPLLDPERETDPKKKGQAYNYMYDVLNLANLLKLTLRDENNPDHIDDLITQFNLNLETEKVAGLYPRMFQKMVEIPTTIDFTDMMWMAIRLDLKVPKYDDLFIDERQDLNPLMLEYAFRMAGDRVITCGDRDQSIMGFAGADVYATERLIEKFGGRELPLNVCYRCGTDIVALAQTISPKILPFEKNPTGEVVEDGDLDLDMPDGSMVLARRNASLVRPCFALIRKGRKAIIKGRDIGNGLLKFVDSMRADSAVDLIDKAEEYKVARIEKLMMKQPVKESAIQRVEDEVQCIVEIATGCKGVDEVKDRIESIFSDSTTQGITLSSAHRSKGLEAENVTIIDYSRIRINNERMTPEDHVQEKNLHYVAVTRAKRKLTLVG